MGRTLAAPRYIGQVGPTVKDFSNQSSGAVGGIFHPETFQAGTIRETHSGKGGQYHCGIFNQSQGGHQVPILSMVDKTASVMGKQALSFSQSNSHSRSLQQCGGLTLPFTAKTRGMASAQGSCSVNLEELRNSGHGSFHQQDNNILSPMVFSTGGGPLLWSVLRGVQEKHHRLITAMHLAPGVETVLSQCSAGVRNMVMSARAPSTCRTYASKWKLFV